MRRTNLKKVPLTQEEKVIIQNVIEVFFKTIKTHYEVDMDTPPHDVASWIIEGMTRQ